MQYWWSIIITFSIFKQNHLHITAEESYLVLSSHFLSQLNISCLGEARFFSLSEESSLQCLLLSGIMLSYKISIQLVLRAWSLDFIVLDLVSLAVLHDPTDTVQPLDGDRVAPRVSSCAYFLVMVPPLPVSPHHAADLAIQEAVRQSDQESLEG